MIAIELFQPLLKRIKNKITICETVNLQMNCIFAQKDTAYLAYFFVIIWFYDWFIISSMGYDKSLDSSS